MLNGDYDQWVISLIAKMRDMPSDRISVESRLYQDLGIWGDDAAELFLEYSEAFSVDMTGFELAKHFPGEANFFNWAIPGRKSRFVPITVRDLVEAAKQRKWVAPR